MQAFLLYGFALVCIVAGLGIAAAGVREVQRSIRAMRWRCAVGVICRAEIEEQWQRRTGDDYHAEHRQVRQNVAYRYSVEGKSYTGTRIGFGEIQTSNAAWLRRRLRGWAEGSSVRVYYDPQAPGEAVLQRRPVQSTLLLIGTGFAFGAAGVGAAVLVPLLTHPM